MKKIFLTTIISLFSVLAFAKTESELYTEYTSLSDRPSRLSFVEQNSSDLLKVWEIKKNTDFFKEKDRVWFYIFNILFEKYGTEMKSGGDWGIAHLLWNIPSVMGEEWYKNLKSSNFIINGKEISSRSKFQLAVLYKDYEQILVCDQINLLYLFAEERNVNAYAQALLESKNPEFAKEKCTELERLYLSNNKKIPTQFLGISRYLSQRIIDKKLLGK